MGEMFSRENGVGTEAGEGRDNCVCTGLQKNVTLWYEFGDLLRNLNKLLCVEPCCGPLLLYSYFSEVASSSKELTVVGRSARLRSLAFIVIMINVFFLR